MVAEQPVRLPSSRVGWWSGSCECETGDPVGLRRDVMTQLRACGPGYRWGWKVGAGTATGDRWLCDFLRFFWERERENARASREAQRERESEAGYTTSEECNVGLHLTTPRPRPEPKSRVRCPTDQATQVPLESTLLSLYLFKNENGYEVISFKKETQAFPPNNLLRTIHSLFTSIHRSNPNSSSVYHCIYITYLFDSLIKSNLRLLSIYWWYFKGKRWFNWRWTLTG